MLHGRLVVGDLADRERLHQLFAQEKFTAVIHLAGSKVAPESVVFHTLYFHLIDQHARYCLSF
ncbi:MAG: NAD-dependent epimerase/dehydratase family protein [Moorea sp. SIO3C2]|nr:NAD-dependent epimerase/dehydratase family protein [Moorena sp. SIO3C2]